MPNGKQKKNEIKGEWGVSKITITYDSTTLSEIVIRYSEDVNQLIRTLWNEELINLQEEMMAFYFNRRHKLISYRVISTGTMERCLVDIKLICSLALQTMACVVILAHNHPSGNLNPSQQDLIITTRIKSALKLFDIELLDHVIISENGYLSIREEGLF